MKEGDRITAVFGGGVNAVVGTLESFDHSGTLAQDLGFFMRGKPSGSREDEPERKIYVPWNGIRYLQVHESA